MRLIVLVQAGVQTEEADLEERRALRKEVGSLRESLGAREQELEELRTTTETRHQRELVTNAETVRERERGLWRARLQDAEEKLARSRGMYNSMLANKEAEIMRDASASQEEAFAKAREEFLEQQDEMRQKIIGFQQQLHTKDQQIAALEREKEHLNTQLEVQAIAYERADYDPMVRKLRQELEDSKVISEALRVELGNRQEEVQKLLTTNQHVQGIVGQIEHALDRERAERRSIQDNAKAERDQMRIEHEELTDQLRFEVEEARGRADAMFKDFERECHITEILAKRHKEAVAKLQQENNSLQQTLRRSRWKQATASSVNIMLQEKARGLKDKGKGRNLHDRHTDSEHEAAASMVSKSASIEESRVKSHHRLSADLGQGLKSIPKGSPNPVTVRENLVTMSKMKEFIGTVQNEVEENTDKIRKATLPDLGVGAGSGKMGGVGGRRNSTQVPQKGRGSGGPGGRRQSLAAPGRWTWAGETPGGPAALTGTFGQIPDVDEHVDWKVKGRG